MPSGARKGGGLRRHGFAKCRAVSCMTMPDDSGHVRGMLDDSGASPRAARSPPQHPHAPTPPPLCRALVARTLADYRDVAVRLARAWCPPPPAARGMFACGWSCLAAPLLCPPPPPCILIDAACDDTRMGEGGGGSSRRPGRVCADCGAAAAIHAAEGACASVIAANALSCAAADDLTMPWPVGKACPVL